MTPQPASPPGPRVVTAFQLTAVPEPLAGGRGTSWRSGDRVLKPFDLDLAALAWQHEHLPEIAARSGLRVSVPVPARTGGLVVEGWTAWTFEPGEHRERSWGAIVETGHRLHAALSAEPRPDWLEARTDRWAVADRLAWGEAPIAPYLPARHVPELHAALQPVRARAQLVHCDLTGNVLFHDRLAPLVIDHSLYWRPTAYASAIVVADALAFEGATTAELAAVLAEPELGQHLLRALLFRIVTDAIALRRAGPEGAAGADGRHYDRAVELALRMVSAA